MKATGEAFSFILKRRGAEEVRYKIYLNFQAKGLLPDRTLESFIKKAPKGQFLIFRGPSQSIPIKSFPNHLGRIFQVKGQSKRVILLFFYSVLFYCHYTLKNFSVFILPIFEA